MDIIFTIVSRNYAAQAASLMESLAAAEPASRRIVVASDGPIPALAGKAEVIDGAGVGAPFEAMRLYYDALELNTAIKPYAFRRLMAEPGAGSVTYMDPDIWVYRPLTEVREALGRAQLCLTPHLTRPLPGPADPNDRTILQSGSYNLGFMAARNDPEVLALLDWWAEKCRLECRVDFAAGLFTDQRWMDLAPGFVRDFERLRQPGLNLAYWNLHGRRLERAGEGWSVDGEPLGFFHFSGFDPRRPEVLSKHQNRTQVADQSPLAAILEQYARALLRNGFEAAQGQAYAHDRFDSGRVVTAPMRRRALRAVEQGEPAPEGLGADAEAWLDAADAAEAAEGLPDVTRLMAQVWRDDPAAAGFAHESLEGRLAFHAWFAQSGADAQAAAAAQRLAAGGGASLRQAADPPWRAPPWARPAAAIEQWFWQAPETEPERAPEALLNARADLRRRFGDDRDGLLTWCIGVEAAAGRLPVDHLRPATVSLIAGQPQRLREAGRLAAPRDLRTDLARELFTAFTLAHRAGWPASWSAPMQAAFARPEGSLPEPFIVFFRTIWDSRADLQRLFPLRTWRQRLNYLRWLAGGGLAEYGVDFEALPQAIRQHPWMKLARATVRRATPPPAAGEGAACALLAVVEDDRPTPGLPLEAVVYRAASGTFHRAAGAAQGAPSSAAVVAFATDPEFVPADALALRARGVTWGKAAGVWSAATVARIGADHPVLAFVDRIETDGADPRLFRPAGPPTPTLAGLIAP